MLLLNLILNKFSLDEQVRLMKQIKEEAEKNKLNDAKKHKEITQLRKAHLKKEQRIKNLETEKHQKEIVLKRKQEEVYV